MIPNQWYAILPSKKVKRGQAAGVRRLNMNLVLFRSSHGELGCVEERCSHRGASLSLGKVQGDCIACPFHGIRFDRNGKCVLVPANGKASREDLSRFNIKAWSVREQNGIIYLWYGEKEKAGGDLPFFYGDADESWACSEIEDHWHIHYSRCIENQLDVVHLPFVHHNTIGRGNRTVVNGPKIEFVPGGLMTSAENETDAGQMPRPAAQCTIKKTYLKFLFPNVWMNHISDRMKVIIYFAPVDDENTILYIRFYSKAAGIRWADRFIAFLGKFGNRIIERQDKRIVVTQMPKASSYKSGEKLIPGDRPVIEYRRIREELKQYNSAGMQEK